MGSGSRLTGTQRGGVRTEETVLPIPGSQGTGVPFAPSSPCRGPPPNRWGAAAGGGAGEGRGPGCLSDALILRCCDSGVHAVRAPEFGVDSVCVSGGEEEERERMAGEVSRTRAPHPRVRSNRPLQTSVVSVNGLDADRRLSPWEGGSSPSPEAFKWRPQAIVAGLLR